MNKRLALLMLTLVLMVHWTHPAAAIIISGQVVANGTRQLVPEAVVTLFELPDAAASKVSQGSNAEPKAAGAPDARQILTGSVPGRGGAVATTRTLKNGSFIIRADHPGRYILSVDSLRFYTCQQDVDVPAQGIVGVELRLISPPTLHLTIVDANNQPVSGLTAESWTVAVPIRGSVETGSWDIGPLTDIGALSIPLPRSITADELREVGVAVRIPSIGVGEAVLPRVPLEPLVIKLSRGLTLSGKAIDAGGKPLAGAQVSVNGMNVGYGARFLQGWASTASAADGTFQIPALLPGRYDVKVEFPGGKARRQLTTLATDSAPIVVGPADRTDPPTRFAAQTPNGQPEPSGFTIIHALESLSTPPAPIVVSGKLTRRDGAPQGGIAVALVAVSDESGAAAAVAVSAPDGSYRMEVPAAGDYTLKIGFDWEGDDLVSVYRSLSVPAAGLASEDIVVSTKAILRIKLLSPDGKPITTGKPEMSFMINTNNIGYGANSNGGIDPDGAFHVKIYNELDTSQVTGITMSIHHAEFGSALCKLSKWPSEPAVVKLEPGTTVSGRVLNSLGNPIANAAVDAQILTSGDSPTFRSISSATCNEAGAFEFTGMMAGTYFFAATAQGIARTGTMAAVSLTGAPPLVLRARSGTGLSGLVLDAEGKPLPNVVVRAYWVDGRYQYPNVRDMTNNLVSDDKGQFIIPGLQPGTYIVVATFNQERSISRAITIPTAYAQPSESALAERSTIGKSAGPKSGVAPRASATAAALSTIKLTFQFPRTQSLKVQVVDAAGKPINGAVVTSYSVVGPESNPSDDPGGGGRTDTDGEFEFTSLELGPHLIYATVPGQPVRSKMITVADQTPMLVLRPGDHL